jgi:hypothetical protein
VIFHKTRIWKQNSKNIGHRKLPRTNLRKNVYIDPKNVFCLTYVSGEEDLTNNAIKRISKVHSCKNELS